MFNNNIRILFLFISLSISSSVFSQLKAENLITTTEWKTIALGKEQKKPIFKDPTVSVRFMIEEEKQYLNISLKYMFTNAVFPDVIPIECYKNEIFEFITKQQKYLCTVEKYARAKIVKNTNEKAFDLNLILSGDLSFLTNELVKSFVVYYAQDYETINLSDAEADSLASAFKRFKKLLYQTNDIPEINTKVSPQNPTEEVDSQIEEKSSLDRIRKQARGWGR